MFSNGDESVCVGCRNRDTLCVSQAEKDDVEARENGDAKVSRRRLERVEAMLETLSKSHQSKDAPGSLEDIPVFPSAPESPAVSTRLSGATDLSKLSEALHNLLPSKDQAYSLCATEKFLPCFFQQLLTRNYTALSANGEAPLTGAVVAQLPPQSAHPVLIAQKLLMYACLTQYHHSASRTPKWQAQASQMAAAAIDLVTTKDALVANAEGPECLMMEATWHVNNGDLRRAFTAVRRAMATAQLLGIHRPLHREYQRLDGSAPAFDPTYIWYRIVHADRIFCLILGLPQGSTDVSFAEPLATSGLGPEEVLERTHCAIAARILERNERDTDDTLATTQSIDAAIQAATSTVGLPSHWWSIPSFSQISSQREVFIATTRLVSQVLHYNLVNQTHLPYLFRSDTINSSHTAAYEYSRAASTTASREILHRYLALQDSSLIAYSYHFVDFFALIAAITLILPHLEKHWSSSTQEPSVLSHMRASDRATILQAMRTMAKAPVCNAPKILTELLAVEEEAYALRSVGSGQILKHDPDSQPYLEVWIPYFGRLKVNSVKICFKRALEIEQLSSSVEKTASLECQPKESEVQVDGALVQDWSLDAFGMSLGVGTDVYGGAENGFLDSFQEFLDGAAS